MLVCSPQAWAENILIQVEDGKQKVSDLCKVKSTRESDYDRYVKIKESLRCGDFRFDLTVSPDFG